MSVFLVCRLYEYLNEAFYVKLNNIKENFLNKKQNYDFRICLVRQPRERPRGDPGHERVPGWSQTSQGSTQTIERLRKAILTFKSSTQKILWKTILSF